MLVQSSEISTIGRIHDDRTKWRVMVQAWPDEAGYAGRLVFAADGGATSLGTREGPAALRGATREAVVSQAYDLSETHLRAMLYSLG